MEIATVDTEIEATIMGMLWPSWGYYDHHGDSSTISVGGNYARFSTSFDLLPWDRGTNQVKYAITSNEYLKQLLYSHERNRKDWMQYSREDIFHIKILYTDQDYLFEE